MTSVRRQKIQLGAGNSIRETRVFGHVAEQDGAGGHMYDLEVNRWNVGGCNDEVEEWMRERGNCF